MRNGLVGIINGKKDRLQPLSVLRSRFSNLARTGCIALRN